MKNHEEKKDYTYSEQKIIPIAMDGEVKKSFIDYAMSVIVSRALPDVRDGLKPVHRRILYAMYEDHLTQDKPFCKSATTVGNVLGRYHPHGDSSVYDAMVRLAQSFSMRYPLIEGHGNFGNVDGDGAAAYRYTEARMAKLANEMLADIDRDVVDFSPNFDNKRKEPDVLPARFPNLLVNGSVGIAVGMATNIPPHNLGEVVDGTVYYMDHPEATVEELMQYIKGPDFPTAALIYGTQGILEAYKTGKGHINVRSRASIDENHRHILITEIPYAVNKAQLVASMAQQVNEKKIEGVTDIRDESGRGGMKIVVDYKKDANPQVILNRFYKFTQLEDTFPVNMIALVNNEPKCLSLPEILHYYIRHQESVIIRRTKFDLDKALARAHILEGLCRAIEDIERVIRIIRESEDIPTAKTNLMEAFSLDDIQAQAIVDMTLGKLAGLERIKLEDELAEKRALIEQLQAILSDTGKVHGIIRDELLHVKEKYADERRTEIVPVENEIINEDLIERHMCVITRSEGGYIKRQPVDAYALQRRGGKGVKGMETKEEDAVTDVFTVPSHAYLLFFTDRGMVHMRKAYDVHEAGRTAKGTHLNNLLELEEGEQVTAMLNVDNFSDGTYLMLFTKNGYIKRTPVAEFELHTKNGKRAITLDDGDSLAFVRPTDGTKDIILTSAEGKGLRFHEDTVRVMGRTARGVHGMNLAEGDRLTGASVFAADDAENEGRYLLTVTENGYGKLTSPKEYSAHGRTSGGQICHGVNEKTGLVLGCAPVSLTDELMLMTSTGMIFRCPIEGIRICGRSSSGVIVMRPKDGAKLVGMSPVYPLPQEGETDTENEGEGQDVTYSGTESEEPEADENLKDRNEDI